MGKEKRMEHCRLHFHETKLEDGSKAWHKHNIAS